MLYSDSCNNMSKNEESERTIEIEIPFHLLQFLSTEGSDIQNLCRICLTMQKNMTGLFSSAKLPLPEMLSSFSTVRPQAEDGLPPQICDICEAQVISCYTFKMKCEKSDHTLKSLLRGEFIAHENQSDPKEIKQEELAGNLENCKNAALNFIENQEKSLINALNAERHHEVENIKDEVEIHEDIQYLENLSDDEIGEETLRPVQNKEEKEKKSNKRGAKLVLDRMVYNESKTRLKYDLKCKYCPKKFEKEKALEAHVKGQHSSEASHPCGQCAEVLHSAHDLALHRALHAQGPAWRCAQCAKEFKTRAMLRRHVSRHMESKKFSCAHCGKAFAELYALRRHARVHSGQQREKRHQCSICDKRYGEVSLLATHMTRHSGARPFPCADCGKGFASARLLRSHRAVHSDSKRHACRYCGARFRHEPTLKTHERTHTGEKPYVCAACGKAFIQNSNLRLHMRTHTGERPYECKQCARRFTSSSSLKAHQRTHSGEKPYTCTFCDKRFACANLTAHLRQHTGERPFECSACRKRFVSAARLRDHRRVHTGEKPFECTVCNQAYTTKSHLTKHLKVHENEKKTKKRVRVKRVDSNNEQRLTQEQDTAMEVTGELVLPDCEPSTEILVVDNSQIERFQNANICLNDVTYANNDNINLVTMNEGGVSISSTGAMLDGTVVKLYQIDQSLVQIHSSCAQVTISKITSKMTANF